MQDVNYSALQNTADYKNGLRNLYCQYNSIVRFAENGNASALAIKADLDKALAILNDKQRIAIIEFLINERDYIIVQDILKYKNPEQVKNCVKHAIRKASKFLN
jgi:hypothetical protein